ncbi:hypothetical protein JCM8115_004203 [Rhodotorula mucilaginosa]
MAPAYEQRLEAALASRLERGMLRSIDPRPKEQQKANLVDFSSNDYISFGRSRRLRQKLVSSLEEKESLPVYGPPSSRLLDGNSPLHAALELRLAAFFRAPTALLFNSGFDANVGLWTCLADQRDWIVYDRLVHASMHDGMRSSRVPASRRRAFAHNSVRNLSELLGEIVRSDEGVRDGTRSVWIGVESLYSMDGDLAPLEEIVQAVEAALPRGNGHIIVDEAHSTGLYGPNGRGLVCALGLADRVLVRVHTFGKAMACSGAAVLASPLIRNYLINYARPLIYSTAMTHLSVLAVQKSLEMLEEGEADPRAAQVHMLAKRLVTRLAASLPPTPPCPTRNVLLPPHLAAIATGAPSSPVTESAQHRRRVPAATSPIIPVLTGSPRPLSAFLQARGYLVRPITYPTVPRGEERVRVCLHAANTVDEVDGLADALGEWVRMNVAALLDQAKDAFYALTGSCCKTDATLKLNGRSFKILQLLGEGGFSYVYLAQDTASGRLFALKKIRCPSGMGDSVKAALKEVEAYKRFRHPNIIRCLDSVVTQSREDDGKIIYLFLPYYKNGTVQHVITANAVNGTRYPEQQMLSIFHGTCLAVRAMHQHRKSGPSAAAVRTGTSPSNSQRRRNAGPPKMRAGSSYPPQSTLDGDGGGSSSATETGDVDILLDGDEFDEDDDDDEDEEDESGGLRTGEEGQALIGGIESARAQLEEEEGGREPAAARATTATSTGGGGGGRDGVTTRDMIGKVGDGQAATGGTTLGGGGGGDGLEPWAHRDIKPANIMLADDNSTPILMDFGSALPARIPIPDRRVALLQQDLAAEHCSMPFRAPELFDVKTGVTLTEAVDIWSLGCTLFAMAYGTSPFETAQQSEHGGSIAMAAMGGKYSFPPGEDQGGHYSERFRELIRRMLRVNPDERPTIQQVIDMTEEALQRLQ